VLSGYRGVRARLEAIEELGAMAVLETEERPEKATIWFRKAPDVKERLLAFVEAEMGCCPFLALEVVETPGRLGLMIAAPEEGKAVVADIVRSFQARR
jgi:hypothetical protein